MINLVHALSFFIFSFECLKNCFASFYDCWKYISTNWFVILHTFKKIMLEHEFWAKQSTDDEGTFKIFQIKIQVVLKEWGPRETLKMTLSINYIWSSKWLSNLGSYELNYDSDCCSINIDLVLDFISYLKRN